MFELIFKSLAQLFYNIFFIFDFEYVNVMWYKIFQVYSFLSYQYFMLNMIFVFLMVSPLLSMVGSFFFKSTLKVFSLVASLMPLLLSSLLFFNLYNLYKTNMTSKYICFYPSYSNDNILIVFDNLNVIFIVLTNFLIFICMFICWNNKSKYLTLYLNLFHLLNFLLMCTFSFQNMFLFFIFFECTLLPMFLIMSIWGSRERKLSASYMLLFYTFMTSILMFFSLLMIYSKLDSFNFYILYNNLDSFTIMEKNFIWISFFLTFSSKMPIYPLHAWLPEAHVEAPTTGSVLLAGILLKIGVFAFIKYLLILFPYTSTYYSPFVHCLCIMSMIYASMTAMRQNDLKRMIAYSSMAHMNLIILGIFSCSNLSIYGAIFQSMSHGFVASALFVLIGIIYDSYHTRLMNYYSGLVSIMPLYSSFFLFFILANMAFPGTSSFIGEILLLFGISLENIFIALLSALGIILCGSYSLWLLNSLLFGNLKTYYMIKYLDLNLKEIMVLSMLFFLTLLFGLYPVMTVLDYNFIIEYMLFYLK